MAPPSVNELEERLEEVQRIAEQAARHCCCYFPDLLEWHPHELCVPHRILQALGVEL